MKKNTNTKTPITIVTHAENFHPDDVFAVATLLVLHDKKIKHKVIRTLEPEKYDANFVVDIGGVYDVKKGRFDHHQAGGAGKRENGVPYASFGLVWKTYGKKITGNQFRADWVDRHIVQAIDAVDSGMYLYTPIINDIHPFLFEEYISGVCDLVKKEYSRDAKKFPRSVFTKKFDKAFMEMVKVAIHVLEIYIEKSKDKEAISKQARLLYQKAKDKRVIISNNFVPTRFDEFKAPEYIEPLVFVYPDLRGGWSAKVVPVHAQSFESRVSFPVSWRGLRNQELVDVTKVPDAKFCHNSGFLAVAESRKGIEALLRLAFEEWGMTAPKF